MTGALDKTALLARLQQQCDALGLSRGNDGAHGASGTIETITSKWWLGGRTVSYRMSCALTDDRTAHYRDAIIERSWGLPPPTLSVETSSIRGRKLSGQRRDLSPGGGGTIDYGEIRDAFEATVKTAGWQFRYEGGRMP